MGRVLLEAMAVKKPIIGTNITGIPTYIKNNFNGLIFELENIDELAECLRKIIGDRKIALEYGKNGYNYLKSELDESSYARKFKEMLANIDKN